MIVGQTTAYKRHESEFTSAEHAGGMVAHHDLVRAVLATNYIDGVHFFLGGKPEDDSPAERLRHSFPGREIAIHPLARLGELSQTLEYVFPVALENLPLLAASRLNAASGQFPISGIVHSISSHASAMLYISLLVLAESYDCIVVTSDAGKLAIHKIFDEFSNYLGQQLNCHFKAKPSIVKIPFGVDENYLLPVEQSMARTRMELPLDKIILLYVGRITEEYKADLEPLLLSFRKIHAANRAAMLLLAGSDSSGAYIARLQQMCTELGIHEAVKFKTNFPFDLKPFLYSSADVFVSPVDNVQETFGIAILEAAACGLPVVASDWSGYRDSVIHGETGFLVPTFWDEDFAKILSASVPLRNQVKITHLMAQHTVVEPEALTHYLRLLVDDPKLRQSMGKKGRERILREYRWSQIIRRYFDLWRDQWQELRARSEQRLFIRLGLNEIYRHFATHPLGKECAFQADSTRASTFRGSHNSPELQKVEQVLSVCTAQPMPAGQLAAIHGNSVPGALSWLWKKGFLRSADQPENLDHSVSYRRGAS